MRKMLLFSIILSFIFSGTIFPSEIEETVKSTKSAGLKEGWSKGGTVTLNLNQVSLTNWAAGGEDTLSLSGLINVYANYKNGKNILENYLSINYGTIRQGDKNWSKSDDLLEISSKYGRNAGGNWYYAGLFDLKTQLANGFNPDDNSFSSRFFSPAYLLCAIGMDYNPNDNLTIFISPVSVRLTIVQMQELADKGAFGVEPATYDLSGNLESEGKISRTELGGYFRLFYKRDLIKNISMQTKLELFSNYLAKPQNVDVYWDFLLSANINDYVSVNLSTNLIYDDDIIISNDTNGDGIIDENGPRLQFKEALFIGFSYKF